MSQFNQGGRQSQGGGRQYQGGPPQPPFPMPSDAELKAIVVDGDGKTLVESARKVGAALASERLTTSQIRGVFATVRLIQMKWPASATPGEAGAALRQLLLLKPRLAYQARRDNSGQGVERLRMVLEPAIDLVGSREQFGYLVDYFEAILAYHRAAGGRE